MFLNQKYVWRRNFKKYQIYSVLLGYDVQSRGIWVATFTRIASSLNIKTKKVSVLNYVRLNVGIHYTLTQRHMPEKRNILLYVSKNIKKWDEAYDYRSLEIKSTTQAKEL
jgi:hypothetical protein